MIVHKLDNKVFIFYVDGARCKHEDFTNLFGNYRSIAKVVAAV